jgi:hypothetical protein
VLPRRLTQVMPRIVAATPDGAPLT